MQTSARRSRRVPILLTLGVLGAAQAGLWFYFQSRQPLTDARTLDRLDPRKG